MVSGYLRCKKQHKDDFSCVEVLRGVLILRCNSQNHSLVHTAILGLDVIFPSDFKYLLVLVVLQLRHSCGA